MTAAGQRTRRLYGSEAAGVTIRERFAAGQWPVAVYGLGKMGLPLAAVFADVTGTVVGVDLDETVVGRINRGVATVRGEPGLDSLVGTLVEDGALTATTDASAAAERATVHVIIVPTTLDDDRHPDLSNLRRAVHAVADGIAPGDVILVESTVPPHTCRSLVRPAVVERSGLDTGEFGVAFCPERTASGRALADIRGAYPKIVGGVDRESTRVARLLYEQITANEVVPVADAATAECVKLFEGVYRDVNIALANELASFTDDLGVDVRAAISAANTQPFCDIHDPGPGVGGHCIPFYPWFLADGRTEATRLLRTARAVNDRMPAYTVETSLERLARRRRSPAEATALVLGVAYRAGVAEARNSPAVDIAAGLSDRGVSTFAVDPVLDELPPMDATPLALAAVEGLDPDVVFLVTPHEAFESLDWDAFDDPLVVDCRDALDGRELPHEVYTIGRG